MIQGPITGGTHGWAFNRPLFDLAARGYVEEEFFIAGDATTYQPVAGSEWGRDGQWQAEAKGTLPFKTRFLVYRPADPGRFNGTVVVCWNNVTAGYELFHGESPEILEGGYAWVGASAQRAGVHGFPAKPQGLAAWDPQRYGELSIPSDEASYDIYAQIGRAVGPRRERSGVDPLGGLAVKQVIALGASQSAGRLATYVNAIHPLGRVFDGFMLQIYFGAGAPLEGDRLLVPSERPAPRMPVGSNLIRALDVPAMIVNTELEAIACQRVRQPDTSRFVTWEAAAMTHVAVQTQVVRNQKYARDFGVTPELPPSMNRIAITPYYDAALHHLTRWAAGGAPAPSQPLIEFAGAPGERPQVVRDEHGIARGGIRMPQAEVPVATNSSIPVTNDFSGSLRGSNHPFGAAKLDALYGSEAQYLARFREAAERAVNAGVLLPRELAPAVEEAAQEYRRAAAS